MPGLRLFGVSGRALLQRLALPEPWQGRVEESLRLIDELEREITACEDELRRLGADHRYVPLLLTVPGIGWVLAYTVAAELGDIARFPSPRKLAGYTGLCPGVYQSGESDRRGPLAKQGPSTCAGRSSRPVHASTHPLYRERLAEPMNRLPKYVASTTLTEPLAWQNATLLPGNVAETVAALKQDDGGDSAD